MYLVIEQWSYKASWHALSALERQAFIGGVGAAVEQLAKGGITTMGFGFNDAKTDQRAGYDFWAVWQCPDAAAARVFQDAVAGSGWYQWFDHKNMCGELLDPGTVLGAHIAA
jgi:hypothetical protein